MDKQFILNHIDELPAEQLADCIKKGIVTIDDLRNKGLDRSLREAILKLLKAEELEQQRAQAQRDKADDDLWESVRYSNEITLIDWIAKNPNNKHIRDAKER